MQIKLGSKNFLIIFTNIDLNYSMIINLILVISDNTCNIFDQSVRDHLETNALHTHAHNHRVVIIHVLALQQFPSSVPSLHCLFPSHILM